MTVRVKRDTGTSGMMANYWIVIDGVKLTKISTRQHIEIPLTKEEATLQIRYYTEKSNQIEVSPGDVVEIKQTFIGKYGVILATLFGLLVSTFINTIQTRMFFSTTALLLFLFLIIISLREGTTLKINKTYSPSSEPSKAENS